MKKNSLLVFIPILIWLLSPNIEASDFFDKKAPADNFSYCDTFINVTIIVAEPSQLNTKLIDGFKKISNIYLKKDHAGSIVSKDELFGSFDILKKYKCDAKIFNNLSEKLVIYIDKDESKCLTFPFDNNNHIHFIISMIVEKIDNSKEISKKTLEYSVRKNVDSYLKLHPEGASLKEIVFMFIDYVFSKET